MYKSINVHICITLNDKITYHLKTLIKLLRDTNHESPLEINSLLCMKKPYDWTT